MDKQRVDKWLWAARFFKTRGLASQAIGRGQVTVNGQRIKPARTLVAGDKLRIEKEIDVFEVTVLALNDQRRPAVEAQTLYQESAESITAREQRRAQHRAERQVAQGLRGQGRPNKKQRRQIIRFQSEKTDN